MSAIWQSYMECNALCVNCPECGAAENVWCTRSDGRVRRIPCVARAAAGERAYYALAAGRRGVS